MTMAHEPCNDPNCECCKANKKVIDDWLTKQKPIKNPKSPSEAGSECMNLLSAEIGPLVAKLAQWERDNGTLACIFGPEQKDAVCEIISDWALTGAMRRCDEWIKSGT